ncbi:hypothetical protein V8F20_007910 [Naviculisporaceae sp. PSN 640]
MSTTPDSAMVGSTEPCRKGNTEALSLHHKVWRAGNALVKRGLTTSEWVERHKIDPPLPRTVAHERVLNEAACLRYLRDNTQVPVPQVLACYEDRGEVYLITEYVEGARFDQLSFWQQVYVRGHLDQLLISLNRVTSDTFGGPGGHVLPPRRFLRAGCVYTNEKKYTARSLVFCHGNLQPRHVIVDPATLDILAITGWGYGGSCTTDYRGTPFDPSWLRLSSNFRQRSQQLWLEDWILDKSKSPAHPDTPDSEEMDDREDK